MEKKKAFRNIEKGAKISKRENKVLVDKAVADAFNNTYNPNQVTKDTKMVSKGVNPIAKEELEKEVK